MMHNVLLVIIIGRTEKKFPFVTGLTKVNPFSILYIVKQSTSEE